MEFKSFSHRDKKLFNKFLNLKRHELAAYSFENIYIWKRFFDISWKIIEDNLCIFFRDKIGCFLYLAPQGEITAPAVIEKAFGILDSLNINPEVSRIENIEAPNAEFFRKSGYACKEKSGDYLCARSDLAGLKGGRFKSKRACLNYFLKNYAFIFRPYEPCDKENCLKLYRDWSRQRKEHHPDPLYQGMISDSYNCLEVLFGNYRNLDFTGRVVEIDGKIRAFTFGYRVNQDTFCILYEITDLSVKGLAQFIFSKFCLELAGYKYINIMDDSGLENLKKVKLSYYPVKIIPAYIAKRLHA